jgi:16S rRNA (cytosine967-C5)-methyltransferase
MPRLEARRTALPLSVRAAAARVVAAVHAGSNLDDALLAQKAVPIAEQPLLKALCYGVVRERTLLDTLAGSMLEKPLRDEPLVSALLACGLFQLRSMRVPPHAAVAETVAAAELLGKPWAKGLTNALLRRYQRERGAIDAKLPTTPEVRLSYPAWLVEAIRRDWPGEWRGVLAAGNAQAPLTLRVNRRHIAREAYLGKLAQAGIAARPLAAAPDALVLAEAVPVEQLPGFAAGEVSVQDASAQLAAPLLDVQPGMRVLDACAAPGGKTAHLLELVDGLDVLALDSQGSRLPRLRDTLLRLGVDAHVMEADASQPARWWKGKKFDRILIDAPCSGTGVLRRHPDIKWLRRETDIAAMADLQQRLLRALWPLLVPQGVLVYATCSILKAEGEDVARAFLAHDKSVVERVIECEAGADWGEDCGLGRRIAPGEDHDGFYYVRFIKQP